MPVLQRLSQSTNPVLLALLLSADVVFVLLHLVLGSHHALFNLGTDRGHSEVFQYIKEYWIAIVLFVMCWRTREGIYGAWALLFAYLLCDDALLIHERVGVAWGSIFAPTLGLRARDFGELAFSGSMGTGFVALITFFHLRCSSPARNVSRSMAVLLGVLVFFGVVVDMVHVAAYPVVRGTDRCRGRGEMVTMSLLASYVVHLLERPAAVADRRQPVAVPAVTSDAAGAD